MTETGTSSAGVGRSSRQPRELGAGLERVRGAAGLGSRRKKSGGVGQTGAPSWGGPGRSSLRVSQHSGAAARARGSALPPRPRRLPGSWARGCGPLGSRAPGGVLQPRSPRARTLPRAAPGAGGTWPVLHLAVAGAGWCRSPSEAVGRRLKVAPKETEVRPSGREEATVRCGTGPGKPRGQPGAGQGGGVSIPESPAPGPGATFPQDNILTRTQQATTGLLPDAETLTLSLWLVPRLLNLPELSYLLHGKANTH